uniref:Uncharacterized protein n=1 Tax=Tanacetum cinerariifolium TaxID=118510 RepID=A0A6L2NTK2_TANCI|nr:hypothetical protein [Tanacetum cinerariifolium]
MQISKINDLIGEIIPCSDLSSRNVPALSAKCPAAGSPPPASRPPCRRRQKSFPAGFFQRISKLFPTSRSIQPTTCTTIPSPWQQPLPLHRHGCYRRINTNQLPTPSTTVTTLTPSTTVTTTNGRHHHYILHHHHPQPPLTPATTAGTTTTAAAFPAAAVVVVGCGRQKGRHRSGGAYKTSKFLFKCSMHGGYIDLFTKYLISGRLI